MWSCVQLCSVLCTGCESVFDCVQYYVQDVKLYSTVFSIVYRICTAVFNCVQYCVQDVHCSVQLCSVLCSVLCTGCEAVFNCVQYCVPDVKLCLSVFSTVYRMCVVHCCVQLCLIPVIFFMWPLAMSSSSLGICRIQSKIRLRATLKILAAAYWTSGNRFVILKLLKFLFLERKYTNCPTINLWSQVEPWTFIYHSKGSTKLLIRQSKKVDKQ